MKKLSLLVIGALAAFSVNAQKIKKTKDPNKEGIRAQEVPVTFHGVTGKLIDYVEPPGTVNEVVKHPKIGYHPKDDWILNETINPNALPQGEDPALQKHYADPAPPTKALGSNWDAISNFNVSPADPTVDVGPNHVVHMTNGPSGAYIQVYSKTGTPIGSQVYFDNFMNMPGGLGDPIVLYDERADRWFLSEFSSSGNNLHIAISQTADPTGAYYTYSFNSTGGFPDYPKYSIWENEYVMTANVGTPDIWVLNRADMLAGNATTAQKFSQSNYGTIGFQASTPVSMLGTTLPPTGAPAMVMRMRDDAWNAGPDALEIWELDIDWANSNNSTFVQSDVLNMSLPFDSELCGFTSFSCIDQPGSNTNLDPLREVLMNRIMYRNFGTHESIVCCHVTDVSGNDDAGIRWYELRRTGGTAGSWTIYQESTYSPDSDSRWMPTIGISASGNIGLAYNVSSGSTFPSLRYTGRKECDAINTMTEPETVIAAGTTFNASNRYGDYNAMGVDPSDGETFYMTGVYNPNTGGVTRIAAFLIDPCAQNPEIAFDDVAFTVNEPDANVSASSCLDYFVIDVPISIGTAPTQDADITIAATGGTATEGVDFDINNPTFTLNGGNLTQNVQIWVYNDAEVEGIETIQLTYTLNANGGDAYAGTTNQIVDITINDDDLDLSAMPGNANITLVDEDFEAGFGTITTVNPNDPTAFQLGNTGTIPNGAFAVNTANTTEFAWVDDDDCDCNMSAVDLLLPSVDMTLISSANLSFQTYFEDNTYQGDNENADVYVSVNGGADQLVGTIVPSGVDGPWEPQSFDVSAYAGNANVVFKIRYDDDGGWLYGLAVDDILLTGTGGPIGIQTAINTGAGMEANLGPNQTVHFIDPTTSDVMVSLENTSTFDYGCVTVEVDRAGTSALEFNTVNTADYLHSKTYTITPTNNNPSGTYNVTLYYEEAEVAGWESATGNSRNNAEIVKVAGANAINDVTPANAASYSITSSGTTLGAFNGDVTFTGAFNSGFSGFGVGVYNPGAPTGPTANFTANTTTICENSSITFTDLSGGTPTSWSWTFGDGGTSTMQNPTHTYTSSGTFTVTLVASNSQGSDTQTLSVTVVAGPSTSQTLEICQGQSVTVGTSTYTSAGTYTDVLTAANGCDSTVTTTVNMLMNTSSTQNVEICQGSSYSIAGNTYTSAGTYTDVITNLAGCDSTITTNLTVNPLPTVTITPATVDPLCSYEGSIVLTGSPSGGTFAGNGVSGSSFDPASAGAGTHVITYSYTDGNGCTGSINLSVEVKDCAGIPEEALEGVTLHPNPNNGNFTISGLENGTTFQIFDERGRLIVDDKVSSDHQQVNMPVVNNGIYYLRATKDGKEGGIKFLIAR